MISFLAPPFLKRLDNKLLTKHPILWVSRIHYVAYYSVLLWILTSLIALVIPIDLSDMTSNGIYYTLFTIISVVLLCVWLYKNALFNIESDYGNRSKTDEYKVFFINFLCVFLLFSFAYPFSYIYNARIAHTLSKEELKNEVNTLNIAEPFFVRSYYDYSEVQTPVKNDVYETDSLNEAYPKYIYKHDINQFRSWGKYTPYRFATASTEENIGLLNNQEQEKAFNTLRANDTKALEAIESAIAIRWSHGLAFDYEPTYILKRYKNLCKEPIEYNNYDNLYDGQFNYSNYELETVLRNIADAQYDDIFIFMWGFNLAMFYFVFFITVFFMMFKSVRWQYFLITIVSLIVLPILLFIFAMMFTWGSHSDFGTVYSTGLLLLYFTAFIVSLVFFMDPKKFNGFKSICMQIFYVCTPVLFMYLVFYLDQNTGIFWHDRYNDPDFLQHHELFETYMWSAIAFGIVFHISFFMVFMKEQFLKMKALPKNK